MYIITKHSLIQTEIPTQCYHVIAPKRHVLNIRNSKRERERERKEFGRRGGLHQADARYISFEHGSYPGSEEYSLALNAHQLICLFAWTRTAEF